MMRAALWKQIAVVFVSAVVLSFLTASLFSDGEGAPAEPEYIALGLPGGKTARVVDFPGEGTPATAAIQERQAALEQRPTLEAVARAREAIPAVRGVASHADMLGFVKRPYTLDDSAAGAPFHVLEMWHDGRFTWLRTNAGQRPALYEQVGPDGGGLLPLGMYPATQGLYVVDGVAPEGGWMQIGNAWARWRLETMEEGQ